MSMTAPEPDLLASLLGGAGGPPPQGGGSPLDALMGGGPPPVEEPEAAPDEGGGSTVEILDRMISDAMAYIDAETDEEDKATMTKVLSTLQGYKASEQKERDGMMQGKVTPKGMRKASSGPSY